MKEVQILQKQGPALEHCSHIESKLKGNNSYCVVVSMKS